MKVQTAFRIEEALLELVKEKAKGANRSLSNYVEHLLYQDVGNIPNQTTIDAIEEAHNDKNLTTIDNLDEYLQELKNS